jgi:hypothetical protein
MLKLKTAIKRAVLGIELREITCAGRGFRVTDAGAKARIETVGSALVYGYDAVLASDGLEELSLRLALIDTELSGFAFEGAGMALTLLDQLGPRRRNRWKAFIDGPGNPHIEVVHVGAGMVFTRLPRGHARLERFLSQCDEEFMWWVVDGYGCSQGFFDPERAIDRQERPPFQSAYAFRAFDQGLGRSLWFVEGADVDQVLARVRTFAPQRRADLFSGVGVAAAYAGGVDEAALGRLAAGAGRELPHLRLGVALAAMGRWQAGNPSPHTATASKVICASADTELAQLGVQLRDQASAQTHNGALPDPYPNHYERARAQLRSAIKELHAPC